MPPAAEIPVSEHLREIPPTVRSMVQAARRTVKAVAPRATEIPYRSGPPRSSRYMFFYRGRELDDGSGLLQGAGKGMRFIPVRAPADAERPAVQRMLRKAFRLGGVATPGAKR
jgi:hypothetical protein